MWAGLGYYRRARFLLEVSCARNGWMGKEQGRAYRKVDAFLAAAVPVPCSMFCLTVSGRLVQSSIFLEMNERKVVICFA
jgi:hypothetical protein